jgi:hypothetical protein
MLDNLGGALDPVRLMWAIAGKESSFGRNCVPRFESAYFTNGRYGGNPPMPELIRLYGKAAASSYGPWQVMLCNCRHRAPADLNSLENCALDFVYHANRILEGQKPPNLDTFAWAYNSGHWHTAIKPEDYIVHVTAYYGVPMPTSPVSDPGA